MKRIWGVRYGIIGDIVISLPVVSFMRRLYDDDCYFNFVINRAHSQCAPLFFNHPKIDRIKITDVVNGYGPRDKEIMDSCDHVFDCAPPSLKPFWWNMEGADLIQATWVMAGLDLKLYHELPEEDKTPKLYRWWDRKPLGKKHIALWPVAAYGGGNMTRNPSWGQWQDILYHLSFKGYTIHHFGWYEEPQFRVNNYHCHTHLSFIEQIKMSLDCEMILGIESGATWSLAAYGEIPQLNVLCMSDHIDHQHTTNPLAYEPKGRLSTSLVVRDSWRNLVLDDVVNKVCDML